MASSPQTGNSNRPPITPTKETHPLSPPGLQTFYTSYSNMHANSGTTETRSYISSDLTTANCDIKREKWIMPSRRFRWSSIELFDDSTCMHQRGVRWSQKAWDVAQYCDLSIYKSSGTVGFPLYNWCLLFYIEFGWLLTFIQGLYPLVLMCTLDLVFKQSGKWPH